MAQNFHYDFDYQSTNGNENGFATFNSHEVTFGPSALASSEGSSNTNQTFYAPSLFVKYDDGHVLQYEQKPSQESETPLKPSEPSLDESMDQERQHLEALVNFINSKKISDAAKFGTLVAIDSMLSHNKQVSCFLLRKDFFKSINSLLEKTDDPKGVKTVLEILTKLTSNCPEQAKPLVKKYCEKSCLKIISNID